MEALFQLKTRIFKNKLILLPGLEPTSLGGELNKLILKLMIGSTISIEANHFWGDYLINCHQT